MIKRGLGRPVNGELALKGTVIKNTICLLGGGGRRGGETFVSGGRGCLKRRHVIGG